jgi:hypothetical protein
MSIRNVKKVMTVICLSAVAGTAVVGYAKDDKKKITRRPGKGCMISEISTYEKATGKAIALKGTGTVLEGPMLLVTRQADDAGVVSKLDSVALPEGQVKVQFLSSFQQYVRSKARRKECHISRATIVSDNRNGNYFITYAYHFGEGKTKAISFLHEGATGDNTVIDCSGNAYYEYTDGTISSNAGMYTERLPRYAWQDNIK